MSFDEEWADVIQQSSSMRLNQLPADPGWRHDSGNRHSWSNRHAPRRRDLTPREQADAPWGLSPVIPENLPWRLGGDPDHTSFGPIAIQIRRGAEVLGYDPGNLTEQQRTIVEESLQDPAQNIFIASEYLAQLKAESEFAHVPAQDMTPAQYQELAARYNGGPGWEGPQAQRYGRRFSSNLDAAREALQ
ncbi:hypothetical protein [Streptomyces sp. NPDC001970]